MYCVSAGKVAGTHYVTCVHVRGHLQVLALPFHCVSQAPNSACQAWWQAAILPALSHLLWPIFHLIIVNLKVCLFKHELFKSHLFSFCPVECLTHHI